VGHVFENSPNENQSDYFVLFSNVEGGRLSQVKNQQIGLKKQEYGEGCVNGVDGMSQEVGTDPGGKKDFERYKPEMHHKTGYGSVEGIATHSGSKSGLKRRIPHLIHTINCKSILSEQDDWLFVLG
jgi:hypothetical protein